MEVKLATTASVFGAAMASMLVAPELQADIVPVSFTPGSVSFQTVTSALVNVQMSTGGGGIGSFSQWNDAIGQTFYWVGGLASWNFAQYSQSINANTFAGYSFAINPVGNSYMAFRTLAGNVGWFQFNLNSDGFNTILYGPGAYGNAGESVHVGTVPAPGALALLAMGAVGIRRKRKRAA